MIIDDLDLVEIVSIEEDGEDECFDISNFEDDCFNNEGNFFCDDVLVHNCIPDYVKNRDINKNWAKSVNPKVAEILKDTYGIIVYQEQLQAMWVQLANFTVPEAEAARKIISKKWLAKLPQVEKQWKEGASKVIGKNEADEWWKKMVDFGRYCFNLSHATAYSIITFQCLYLKAYFPAEWWAAVLTECQPYKHSTYMSAAKLDGVKFGNLDVNKLTMEYSVKGDQIVTGLLSVKGIGKKSAKTFSDVKGPFLDVDDMVKKCGKSKKAFERFIKLGGFDLIHKNRRGLWIWYQYMYCSGDEQKRVKKFLHEQFGLPEAEIKKERDRQIKFYKLQYPKKNVIPSKILNWRPKVELKRDDVIDYFNDYSPAEILQIEKELLGYYWSSPLDLYQTNGYTIEEAKTCGQIEAVIETVTEKKSQKGNKFFVFKLNDGVQTTDVTVWADVYENTSRKITQPGVGICIGVDYNEDRRNFKICNGGMILPLFKKD